MTTVKQLTLQNNKNLIYLVQVERASNNSQTINLEKIKIQFTCRLFKGKGRENKNKNQLATVSQQQQSIN